MPVTDFYTDEEWETLCAQRRVAALFKLKQLAPRLKWTVTPSEEYDNDDSATITAKLTYGGRRLAYKEEATLHELFQRLDKDDPEADFTERVRRIAETAAEDLGRQAFCP